MISGRKTHRGRRAARVAPVLGFLALVAGPLAFLGAPAAVAAPGAGGIMVSPTRIVFAGRERSAHLTLVNGGTQTTTYRISVVNMAMNETGGMTPITKPGPGLKFAENLFRYAPRQVTLVPGQTQAIRFLLRKPVDLADGEYRSRLLIQALPNNAGRSIEQPAPSGGVQVRLIPVYGVTIPIIVRQGNLTVHAAISNLKLLPAGDGRKQPILRFKIDRSGDRSAFGDLRVVLDRPGGSQTVVGEISRLAVYTPNADRIVEVPMRLSDGTSLSKGKLTVTYRAPEDEGGRMLAQGTLALK